MRDPSGKTFITEQQAIAGAVAAPTFGYTPYKTGRRVVELGVKYAYLEVEPHSLGSSAHLVHKSHCIEMRGEAMATPKEPVRDHCRIRLIVSVQFDNAPPPVGCKPTISPLNSFPLPPRQVKLEENHDATQISKWIFDQEKQQVS
jgi:hypothetical protein